MTIRDDKKESQNIGHHDTDLSALYQSLSTEKPSLSADSTILKLAQQAAKTRRQKSWLNKWSTPVSVAAVIVLSVSIVTVLQQESARSPEILSKAASPTDTESFPENKKEDIAKLFDLSARNETLAFEGNPKLDTTESDADNEQSVVSPAASPISPPLSSQPTTGFAKQRKLEKIENTSAQTVAPVAEIASGKTLQAKPQRKKESAELFKPIQSELEQIRPALQTRLRQASKQPLKQSLKQSLRQGLQSIPAPIMETMPQTEVKPKATFDNSTISSDSVSSIQNKKKFRSRLTMAPKPNQESKSLARLCAKTSHSKCLASLSCILIKDDSADNGLHCIDARGYCEKQFVQADFELGQCQLRKNCWLRPGKCQCNEDGNCTCEEAGPPMCVPDN